MITAHPVQREILSSLRFFNSGAKYRELKPAGIENDLFNYHLQFLVKNGLVEKQQELYVLTTAGKSVVTNIDEQDRSVTGNYKVSVYMCPVVDGRVLLHRRKKHPQYGYTGLISGKIKYGERILDTAAREFEEETGMKASFQISGNVRQIRRDAKGKVIEDGVFYVCYADRVGGTLTQTSLEGEYFWMPLAEVGTIEKIFKPSLELICGEIHQRIRGEKNWESSFIYELEPDPEEY